MWQQLSLFSLSAALMMFMVGCESTGPIGSPAKPMPILAHYRGDDAGLKHPMVKLITSRQQLESLDAEQLVQMDVDFNKKSLVVLAVGEQLTGGYWAQITGAQKSADTLYVQGVVNRPAPDQIVTAALTHAVAVAVIDKVEPLSLSSQISDVVGQQPTAE